MSEKHPTPSQHTPGPWQRSRFVASVLYRDMSPEWRRDRETEEERTIRGPGEVGTPGCNIVARVECGNPADFTLMIAAPDLLAALEDALDSLEYVNRNHRDVTGYGVRDERITAARAALAKATGS